VKKYCRAVQAADDTMAIAHCMLGNGAKNTHIQIV